MAGRQIRCALLTAHESMYDTELTVACPGLDVVALHPSASGLRIREPDPLWDPNRFPLPEDDRAEVILIESRWYRLAAARHPDRIDEVIPNLQRRAELVIGLEGDLVALGFPPSELERLAILIKFNGLYRDRDLYNYLPDPEHPDPSWAEKLHPRSVRYRASELDKLRLSLPCFMSHLPPIRRAARSRVSGKSMCRVNRIGRNLGEALLVRSLGLVGPRGRSHDVHCLVAPSHPQRIEAVRLLQGLSGRQGLVINQDAPETDLIEDDDGRHYYEGWIDEQQIEKARALLDSARPFAREPLSRVRYLLDMRRHKVVLAPGSRGQEELTYRHGEALACGAALVCQDLGRMETMFPFTDGENVVYCRPDLSDLRTTVEGLLGDAELWRGVGREGRRTYVAWARRWREHLYEGIERHIREALGLTATRQKAVAHHAL